MAAFEAVSTLTLQPLFSKLSIIDLRNTELPLERPSVEDDFDPRNYRNPKVAIKPWMAYINLLRATVGLGMLGAPLATSQAGMLFGPFLILFIGGLLIHTHLMLLWCLNEICRQLKIPYISYRYGARMALLHGPPLLHGLANWGPFIIAVFMLLSQLGICSVNIIFIADNLRDMMDWTYSSTSLMYMIIPFLCLEILMKNLRTISYVINAGNAAAHFLGLSLSRFYDTRGKRWDDAILTRHNTANAMNLVALIIVLVQIYRGPRRDTQLFPLGYVSLLMATGGFMFNMSAVGVILSCEKALEKPHVMSSRFGVVKVGLIVPTLVTILIGTLGFWSYGVMEENVLRYLPYDEPVTMVAFGLYSASSILSYPLACYPGYQIILEVIKNHDPYVDIQPESLKLIELVARPIFVCMTFIIAYFVPYQGPYVAFVGSFCTTLMSLVLPALMEIGLCYPSYYGRFNLILLKDLLIVVMGLIIWSSGIMLCGYLLYVRILTSKSPIVGSSNEDEHVVDNYDLIKFK